LIDTLKRVWNFRVNYAPIRLAIGRSLLSGDVPDFELRGEDGRAIDTQQIFSGDGSERFIGGSFKSADGAGNRQILRRGKER